MTELPTDTRLQPWLEQAWLDRYLANQLTASEADQFEAYMLDKPDIVAVVEQDTDLRAAFDSALPPNAQTHDAAATNAPVLTVAQSPPAAQLMPVGGQAASERKDTQTRTARIRWLQPMALAASLVAAVAGGWLGHRAVQQPMAADPLLANPTRISYVASRGIEVTPLVANAESRSRYLIVELVVPIGASDLAVRIDGHDSQALQASDDGIASFLLDRDTAASGAKTEFSYRLRGEQQAMAIDLAALLVRPGAPPL